MMKIVHELYVECQTGGGTLRPYSTAPGDPLPVSGYLDELLIVSPASGLYQEEPLYISGDIVVVREALLDALACIELSAQHEVEQGRLAPDWKARASEYLKSRRPRGRDA